MLAFSSSFKTFIKVNRLNRYLDKFIKENSKESRQAEIICEIIRMTADDLNYWQEWINNREQTSLSMNDLSKYFDKLLCSIQNHTEGRARPRIELKKDVHLAEE